MTDRLKTYGIELLEEAHLAMETDLDNETALTTSVINQISDLIDCQEPHIQHCTIKDKAGKILGEIHGFAESTNEEVLYLFYTIYNPSCEITTKNNTEVQPAINRAQGFYKKATQACYEDFDANSPEYEALKYIYDNNHKYQSIHIMLFSNHIISNVQIKKVSITSKPVYLDVWDLRKMYENTHTMSDHIPIDIDFDSEEYSRYKIYYLQMESDLYGYKCLQLLFPAKLIHQLYEKHNTNLLYNNVRYFLGLKGAKDKKPNVAMLDTLRNENEMFLAYNNGITALAKGIEGINIGDKNDITDIEENGLHQYVTMGQLKKILDFRIVNGGQTCATIFNARKLSKETTDPSKKVNLIGVYVQVKLIISDEIEQISGKITTSSNFQNQIKAADFSVSNEFNRNMEVLSRSIIAPNANKDSRHWFFERLRGQYDEGKKNKRTKPDRDLYELQYPHGLKFTKEEMAKVWCAWAKMPHEAVKGASTTYTTFMNKVKLETPIPDEDFYKKLIAKLIIFRFLKQRPENKSYGNGKATVMAFTLAALNELSRDNFNLLKVWEDQNISDNLMIYLNTLSDAVYSALANEAVKQNTTILSFGKSKGAFESVLRYNLKADRNLLVQYKICP